MDRKLVAGLGPRLAGQHVRDVNVARLDDAGLGVDNAVPLLLDVDRLPFQDDDADIAVRTARNKENAMRRANYLGGNRV